MMTTNMHPAESYLRNVETPSFLYVKIDGKRRRLFFNRNRDIIGIIAQGKKNSGYEFHEWSDIEKIYYPLQPSEVEKKRVLKYQRLAKSASHTNDWIRRIANADVNKSLSENRITTGTEIDGKCISLDRIKKYCGTITMKNFMEALKNKAHYESIRFDFCGYDGHLWCMPQDNGDMAAGFSKEYRNCGNGYYYLLINDKYMIGYDVD